MASAIARDATPLKRVWEALKGLSTESLVGEGRVYGGGLHKLEPKELGNVDATTIANIVRGLRERAKPVQLDFLEEKTA